ARQLGVAIAVEQALLGHERGALPIDVYRASFVDERRAIAREALDLEHLAGYQVVLIPGKIQAAAQPSPGVEAPVDTAHLTAPIEDTGRSDIAHPGIVVRHLHEPYALIEEAARHEEVSGRNPHGDRLKLRNRQRHLRESALRRTRRLAPVVGPVRP